MIDYKICSGSTLKLIAVFSMLVDHVSLHVLQYMDWMRVILFQFGHICVTPYLILRGTIGRLAFPLFAFLVVEGYIHTHSKKKYAQNLLLFAVISEPIWDLVHCNHVISFTNQNVMFTLFLGVIGIRIIEINKNNILRIAYIIGLTFMAFLLHLDYGMVGIALIVLLYILHSHIDYQAVALIACFGKSIFKIFSIFSIIPILMYNGKRGFIKGIFGKYFFYVVYPLHLFILYLLKYHYFVMCK